MDERLRFKCFTELGYIEALVSNPEVYNYTLKEVQALMDKAFEKSKEFQKE